MSTRRGTPHRIHRIVAVKSIFFRVRSNAPLQPIPPASLPSPFRSFVELAFSLTIRESSNSFFSFCHISYFQRAARETADRPRFLPVPYRAHYDDDCDNSPVEIVYFISLPVKRSVSPLLPCCSHPPPLVAVVSVAVLHAGRRRLPFAIVFLVFRTTRPTRVWLVCGENILIFG